MSTKLKERRSKKNVPPIQNFTRSTMNYREAEQNHTWEIERECADKIMEHVRRHCLGYKLDELTRGLGSCFMIAVLQQINRPEVFRQATSEVQTIAQTLDHKRLRKCVKEYIQHLLETGHQKVIGMKEFYNVDKIAREAVGEKVKTWEDYWKNMEREVVWADSWFIQSTAWYLNMEIKIIDTAGNDDRPYYFIDADIDDLGFYNETLCLGLVTNTHYQSLLDEEEEVEVNRKELKDSSEKTKGDTSVRIDDDKCLSCGKKLKNVLQHIKKSKICRNNEEGKKQSKLLEEKSLENRRINKRFNESKRRKRLRDEDEDSFKRKENEWKSKGRKRLRDEDEDSFKSKENKMKSKSRGNLKNKDYEAEKKKLVDLKSKSRQKRKNENPEAYTEENRRWRLNYRSDESEYGRLRNFLDATMYGPIFICISCHGKMFRTNVQIYTAGIAKEISEKIPIESCIADENLATMVATTNRNTTLPVPYKNNILKIGSIFICNNCYKYLNLGKLPPSSVKNSLELYETDAELKKQDLWLTELEGSLIAQNLLFEKIMPLPTSRWTGLNGKVINVPISVDAMNRTLEQLPRTPAQAGLIQIGLKRKLDMVNTHKKQLINPNKVFRMLEKLKKSGSPYHQNLNSPENFKKICYETDKYGHQLLYGKDDIEEDVENVILDTEKNLIDEFMKEFKEEDVEGKDDYGGEKEEKYEDSDDEDMSTKKDPIKQYQFHYDESLCMMDKYPEINIAPGEGQRPKGILGDKNWDVKAFPHLHNPDGSNGKDQKRIAKLTDQRYFIQRIINKEKRFAETPTYIYGAVAYLEEKRIFGNLSLVGSRGKEIRNAEGKVSYVLEDEFRVLEGIKNTPKYWQKMKYEILAKIDNLGPFHLFFTLSCADQRWDATFGAILGERGYKIIYNRTEKHGKPEVVIEVKTSEGEWVTLQEFLENEIDESRHELIRGNVVMATRYYHARVKAFIAKIVLAKGNPMNVKYYTYKVEFQGRGAAHIHGTLWLHMEQIERLQLIDGTLRNSENIGPLKGLCNVFKKLKVSAKLSKEDMDCLKYFIDIFITVCTNKQVVGDDVAKAVLEVNQHKHTKTCRKHGTVCRFNYPRPPAPFTIIVQPATEKDPEKRKKFITKCNEIVAKVMCTIEDPEEDTVEEIMSAYDKASENQDEYKMNRIKRIKELCEIADVSYCDYIEALGVSSHGYSVVYARDLDELYSNPYNVEWMRAWNGNLDLQPCLDYFAVSTYIADYYAKADTVMMDKLTTALKQTEDTDIKARMKVIANMFLTHRQIGEAEAVYRLIPNLTLTMSNVACQFVSTSRKDERSMRWRRASEDQLEKGIKAKQLANHDGFWFEQPDMWNKYLRRPEGVKDMCFAQFAKMYKGFNQTEGKKDGEFDDELILDDSGSEDDDENTRDGDIKFHFIITFKGKKGKPLPSHIALLNPYPAEAAWMKKRSRPAALRFHKYKKDNDHKRYMLSEIMLYKPLDGEVDDDKIEKFYNEMYNGERKITLVKKQVMEHLESVAEARYYVDQMNKEAKKSIEEDAEVRMDPMGNQIKEDDEEELIEDHEDYLYCNPDNITKNVPSEKGSSMFRRVELPLNDELRKRTEGLDKYQKEVVNIVVTYAKDLVKARKYWNKLPKAPLMMIHGGAGAGKSTVINVIALWAQKILQQEGDSLDEPYVIKTSFTGCAASNIEGLTLHKAFGFSFGNKHYSLNDKVKDQKKTIMRNLKLVIVDEVSMMKVDMLYQMDLRLQELKGKVGTPFGGVGIIAFGDLMQLRPCQARYIFQIPANPEFEVAHIMNPLWNMFKSVLLEKNHRQGRDKDYADLLNRIRVGKQTEEDMELLSTRVRPKNHEDIRNADMYVGCKRKDVAKMNNEYFMKLGKREKARIMAKHHQETQKKYKPYISKKDGSVGSTSFMDELWLKLDAKVMLIHNIDIPDMLTNGQIGTLVDMIKCNDNQVELLVIKLVNKKAGEMNRKKNPSLSQKYPECVFIERVTMQYSLRKKSNDIGTTATVIQFPVRLSYATTAHKIQGQSLLHPMKVAMNIDSAFECGQAYVMLSRIQSIDQLYIVGNLSDSKIMTSMQALNESKRLEDISFNKNPPPWHLKDKNAVRIATVNCAGLIPHLRDIRKDEKLLEANVIHILETSLPSQSDTSNITIEGYIGNYINIANGKGIASFCREDTQIVKLKEIREHTLQIVKYDIHGIESIAIYRSSNHSLIEVTREIEKIVNVAKPTIVTGDFNECNIKNGNNSIVLRLTKLGFKQLVKDATHIEGGHIDHMYWLDETGEWEEPTVERYSPYWSDHDMIGATIQRR